MLRVGLSDVYVCAVGYTRTVQDRRTKYGDREQMRRSEQQVFAANSAK